MRLFQHNWFVSSSETWHLEANARITGLKSRSVSTTVAGRLKLPRQCSSQIRIFLKFLSFTRPSLSGWSTSPSCKSIFHSSFRCHRAGQLTAFVALLLPAFKFHFTRPSSFTFVIIFAFRLLSKSQSLLVLFVDCLMLWGFSENIHFTFVFRGSAEWDL